MAVSAGRIGLLTSGGDAPGMNAVIVGALRHAAEAGVELCLVEDGYRGLVARRTIRATLADAMHRFHRAGTWIGTSRWPDLQAPDGLAAATQGIEESGLDSLIVVGGAGSLAGARALHGVGVPVVGVPATIDNDVPGVPVTLGLDSAVNYALRVIDDVRVTATSLPHRAFLVETLGGSSGNLARAVAEAAAVDLVITPEDADAWHAVVARLPAEVEAGHGLVVTGEGVGPAQSVADDLQDATGLRIRVTVLGHGQRAASPTAADRRTGLALGRAAVDAAATRRSGVVAAPAPDAADPLAPAAFAA